MIPDLFDDPFDALLFLLAAEFLDQCEAGEARSAEQPGDGDATRLCERCGRNEIDYPELGLCSMCYWDDQTDEP